MPGVGGEPIFMVVAVMVVVFILLVVRELTDAASIITLFATIVIFPEFVRNWPEVFTIVLVASRLLMARVPVEIDPPVLSIITFTAEKLVTLSATKLLVTFISERVIPVVVNFWALTAVAYITPVLILLKIPVLIVRKPPSAACTSPLSSIVEAVSEDAFIRLFLMQTN